VRTGVVGRIISCHARADFRMLAGKQGNGVGTHPYAVRRHQCRRMSAREIAGNHQVLAIIAVQMQVEAGALERAAQEPVRIGELDDVGMRRVWLNYGCSSAARKFTRHESAPGLLSSYCARNPTEPAPEQKSLTTPNS